MGCAAFPRLYSTQCPSRFMIRSYHIRKLHLVCKDDAKFRLFLNPDSGFACVVGIGDLPHVIADSHAQLNLLQGQAHSQSQLS